MTSAFAILSALIRPVRLQADICAQGLTNSQFVRIRAIRGQYLLRASGYSVVNNPFFMGAIEAISAGLFWDNLRVSYLSVSGFVVGQEERSDAK